MFISFIFYIIMSIHKATLKSKALEKEHEILMQIERNKQVHYFRLRLMQQFDAKIVKCMPSYTDMLWSDKPLVASEWVDVDKFVGKEVFAEGELIQLDSMTIEYSNN